MRLIIEGEAHGKKCNAGFSPEYWYALKPSLFVQMLTCILTRIILNKAVMVNTFITPSRKNLIICLTKDKSKEAVAKVFYPDICTMFFPLSANRSGETVGVNLQTSVCGPHPSLRLIINLTG